MVCNRRKLTLRGRSYVSYDYHYFYIAIWILKLHLTELYKLKNERYQDARKRYEASKIGSSLKLLGATSQELLELFNQYHAVPPLSLLYDCLNSHITLFNAGEKKEKELVKMLENCDEYLSQTNNRKSEVDLSFVKYALARGYFALGIESKEYWNKGRQLLEQ